MTKAGPWKVLILVAILAALLMRWLHATRPDASADPEQVSNSWARLARCAASRARSAEEALRASQEELATSHRPYCLACSGVPDGGEARVLDMADKDEHLLLVWGRCRPRVRWDTDLSVFVQRRDHSLELVLHGVMPGLEGFRALDLDGDGRREGVFTCSHGGSNGHGYQMVIFERSGRIQKLDSRALSPLPLKIQDLDGDGIPELLASRAVGDEKNGESWLPLPFRFTPEGFKPVSPAQRRQFYKRVVIPRQEARVERLRRDVQASRCPGLATITFVKLELRNARRALDLARRLVHQPPEAVLPQSEVPKFSPSIRGTYDPWVHTSPPAEGSLLRALPTSGLHRLPHRHGGYGQS